METTNPSFGSTYVTRALNELSQYVSAGTHRTHAAVPVDEDDIIRAIDLIRELHAQNVTWRTTYALCNTFGEIDDGRRIAVRSKSLIALITDDIETLDAVDPRITQLLVQLPSYPDTIPAFQAINLVRQAIRMDNSPYPWNCSPVVAEVITGWQQSLIDRGSYDHRAGIPFVDVERGLLAIIASAPPSGSLTMMVDTLVGPGATDADRDRERTFPLSTLVEMLRQYIQTNIS